MLALNFLRYWWLRPHPSDPAKLESSEEDKALQMTSILDPLSAPQFENVQQWAKIPQSTLDSMTKSAIEIEKALAEGKDMILVEPSMAGHYYSHYICSGWLLQENAAFYGSISVLASHFYPSKWFIYIPCTLLSFIHSWMYFKVYKYDRLSQYQIYDDDRHPVSNLVTAWILGQRPTHFQYILKKERMIVWEIISEVLMYTSVITTLKSLKRIEGLVMTETFFTSTENPTSLWELLSLPAYSSGYFQPPELLPGSPGVFLPSDIPVVEGWFDLPWFNVRFNPMKFDFAVILCGFGGYFMYKMYQHFFEYDGEEVNAIDREWLNDEVATRIPATKPYWLESKSEGDDALDSYSNSPEARGRKVLQEQEEKAMNRISAQVPYGYIPLGFPKNHYAVFT